jgi:hypothetical protein
MGNIKKLYEGEGIQIIKLNMYKIMKIILKALEIFIKFQVL